MIEYGNNDDTTVQMGNTQSTTLRMDVHDHGLVGDLLTSNKHEQRDATQHDFLKGVGNGTLSPKLLSTWLVQDKYYQCAYVRFVARLIEKIDLRSIVGTNKQDSLEWNTFRTLFAALEAIKAEIDFYDETVSKYKLDLEIVEPNHVTKQYIRLFEATSDKETDVLVGLVVLWATEYVYLRAWTYAKDTPSSLSADSDVDNAMLALHKEFIPNWTSDEFRSAVSSLAKTVNAWYKKDPASGRLKACQDAWLQVLQLETDFWPMS